MVPTQGGRGYPIRDRVTGHTCRCLILRPGTTWDDEKGLKTQAVVEDRCGIRVRGPDEPFCEHCEDRHPDIADRPRVIVTVWT